jgi:hypothetical protein
MGVKQPVQPAIEWPALYFDRCRGQSHPFWQRVVKEGHVDCFMRVAERLAYEKSRIALRDAAFVLCLANPENQNQTMPLRLLSARTLTTLLAGWAGLV